MTTSSSSTSTTTFSFIHEIILSLKEKTKSSSIRFMKCFLLISVVAVCVVSLNVLLLGQIRNRSQMLLSSSSVMTNHLAHHHHDNISSTNSFPAFKGFPYLNEYQPPSVPKIFQIFVKTAVDLSFQINHDDDKDEQQPQQHFETNNFEEKQQSPNVHNKKKYQEGFYHQNRDVLFSSTHRCIRYRLDLERRQNSPLFTTCLFENICFNRRGEWILYSKSQQAKDKSGQVWVQTYPYTFLTGDIHRVRVKVLDPPRDLLFRGVNGIFDTNHATDSIMILSKNFKWIEKPTFGTSRHATANVGHAILDNFALVFNSMLNFDYVSPDSHILFMDDMYPNFAGDTRTPELIQLHGDIATNTSIEWAQRMTNLETLQQCLNAEEGAFIKKAPCQVAHIRNPENEKADEVDTCFSSLVVGSTGTMYGFIEGRESVVALFRKFLLRQMKELENSRHFSKTFRIAIQNKPLNSINRDAIINVDKIVRYLTTNISESEMLELANQARSEKEPKYERVEIVNLKLEKMTFEEQVEFFGDLDVYVSSQGAASYMSLFMTKPNAVMLYVPMCFRNSLTCSDYNLKIHETLATNVKIISLVHYAHLLECVKGNSDEEEGFKVKAQAHTQPYGDCHERIDPEGLYRELITKALQRLL
nr:unnamed protein product [Naegleria fowleri]